MLIEICSKNDHPIIDLFTRKRLFSLKIWNSANNKRSCRLNINVYKNTRNINTNIKCAEIHKCFNVCQHKLKQNIKAENNANNNFVKYNPVYKCCALSSLYLLNAASLAIPHALDQLKTDLLGYNSAVALITETHFKKKHKNSITTISGYNIIRQDREKRRGGGVAILINNAYKFSHITTPESVFEILWVMVETTEKPVIIGVLYHPPKSMYTESSLLSHIENCIFLFNDKYPGHTIILGGDFNTLSHEAIVEHTAIFETVQRSTRGSGALDKICKSH